MDYSHIFGSARGPRKCVVARRIVTSSLAVVTTVCVKARLPEGVSLVRGGSIPGEYASQISQENRMSIASRRSGAGHLLPGWVAANLSATADHMHSSPRTQPIFAARKPRLHIEEFGR